MIKHSKWDSITDFELVEAFFDDLDEKEADGLIDKFEEEVYYDSTDDSRPFHSISDLRMWFSIVREGQNVHDAVKNNDEYPAAIQMMRDYIYYSVMNFCGCGDVGAVDSIIDRLFSCFPYTENGTAGFDYGIFKYKFNDLQTMDPSLDRIESKREFLMHWMDSVGFTDHGTTVRYPWLSYYFGFIAKEVFHRWVTKYRAICEEKE